MNESQRRIVVAPGDGVGPEITEAVLEILRAARVPLEWETVELGQKVYEQGETSGVPPRAWELLRERPVLLKGPITTPQGKGFKSVNVTLRKALHLFANVRPSKAYTPSVASLHPGLDLVIIRENEEDLYAGIEHRQTQEVYQTLKIVTRPGTEKIIRYAFEYARAYGRRKVTCMTKDNIMKGTDGLFHEVFDEVGREYPDLKQEHLIIDIGSARLAATPERFDVIVTLNLYGDILSDIAAQLSGSIGLASSANIGERAAMFEAVHGSAPDIAGRGIANPSGLLLAAVQMLVHLGLPEPAEGIQNAWLATLEDGIHTPDIYREGLSSREVGTEGFSRAVIERLGEKPQILKPVAFAAHPIRVETTPKTQIKRLVGVDVFLGWDEAGRDPRVLGERVRALGTEALPLVMISNRGVKVYPGGARGIWCADQWRCRFRSEADSIAFDDVLALLARCHQAGLEVVKTEHLYTFDGKPGFSLGQGE